MKQDNARVAVELLVKIKSMQERHPTNDIIISSTGWQHEHHPPIQFFHATQETMPAVQDECTLRSNTPLYFALRDDLCTQILMR